MTSWLPPPTNLCLTPAHVDVFRISTELESEALERLHSVLSDAQRARSQRIRFENKRRQYVVAQGFTRLLLGNALESDPGPLEFVSGPKGKPYLGGAFAGAGVQFNMTHTSEMALIALSRNREVGVDIERIRDNLQWEKLARRYFSPREYRGYSSLPAHTRLRAFFTCWTRKESVLKAIGTGLGGGLRSFDISTDPDAPPVLEGNRWEGRFHGDWTLTQLDPGEGYVATLAVERSGYEVRCWEGEPVVGRW